MTGLLLPARPEMGLDEAVDLILRYRIGGLPVVRDGKLVGILTRSDLLHALTACLRPGPRKRLAKGKGRRPKLKGR